MAEEVTNTTFGGSWGWLILIFLFFLGFGGGMIGGNTNNDVSNDIIRDIAGVNTNILTQGSETREAVNNSRYDTLLGFKDMQYQQAQCCCELKTAVHSEGEATRALIMEDRINALREALNTATTAYNNLSLKDQIISALSTNSCSCNS